MTTVTMPSLVDSMTDGVISRWLKREGELVEQGEELVEIETEKVTMEYEAPGSGYLEIVTPEGTVVAVGDVIAHLATEPGAAAVPSAPAPALAPETSIEPEPIAEELAARAPANGSVRATPLARQLAEQHGADLAALSGSGPRGRVTRNDVASSLGLPDDSAPEPAPDAPSAPEERESRPHSSQELSRLQQTVARRMSESHSSIPAFQVETEVAMNEVVAIRDGLKRIESDRPVPSLNDFVVRACALALREHPRANASYRPGRFLLFAEVNVGVAVAAGETLVVPVVARADTLSLFEIAAETRRLAEWVRAGTITPGDLSGATFTVSNLGMFGMTAITPIIDAPQAAILGVGSIREGLALEHGAVVTRRTMTLRMSCDHRILYGADAARFLSTIRELLEQPLGLLLN